MLEAILTVSNEWSKVTTSTTPLRKTKKELTAEVSTPSAASCQVCQHHQPILVSSQLIHDCRRWCLIRNTNSLTLSPSPIWQCVWWDVKPCSVNQPDFMSFTLARFLAAAVKELKLAQFKNELLNGLALWLKRENRKMAMCYFNEMWTLFTNSQWSKKNNIELWKMRSVHQSRRTAKAKVQGTPVWRWSGQPQSTIAISLSWTSTTQIILNDHEDFLLTLPP